MSVIVRGPTKRSTFGTSGAGAGAGSTHGGGGGSFGGSGEEGVLLICKGADNVVLERLSGGCWGRGVWGLGCSGWGVRGGGWSLNVWGSRGALSQGGKRLMPYQPAS